MWVQLTVILVSGCLAIAIFLRSSFTITSVHGESMFPSLEPGDRFLTVKALSKSWLQKGQIVVGTLDTLNPSLAVKLSLTELAGSLELPDITAISSEVELLEQIDVETLPEMTCTKFVKRIVGLPGDQICISLASLPDAMQTLLKNQSDTDGNLVWSVPESHCFVQGDNPICVDSLTVGPIPLSAITGIMLLKLPQRLIDSDTPFVSNSSS